MHAPIFYNYHSSVSKVFLLSGLWKKACDMHGLIYYDQFMSVCTVFFWFCYCGYVYVCVREGCLSIEINNILSIMHVTALENVEKDIGFCRKYSIWLMSGLKTV